MIINDDKELLKNFRETCKHHKPRATPQRVLIYKELLKSQDHPSSDVLYERIRERFPDVSFDTVYRTLATFAEIGLIDQVDGFGTVMRFDFKIGEHHHFRCRECGQVIDLDSDYYNKMANKYECDVCELPNIKKH